MTSAATCCAFSHLAPAECCAARLESIRVASASRSNICRATGRTRRNRSQLILSARKANTRPPSGQSVGRLVGASVYQQNAAQRQYKWRRNNNSVSPTRQTNALSLSLLATSLLSALLAADKHRNGRKVCSRRNAVSLTCVSSACGAARVQVALFRACWRRRRDNLLRCSLRLLSRVALPPPPRRLF